MENQTKALKEKLVNAAISERELVKKLLIQVSNDGPINLNEIDILK